MFRAVNFVCSRLWVESAPDESLISVYAIGTELANEVKVNNVL